MPHKYVNKQGLTPFALLGPLSHIVDFSVGESWQPAVKETIGMIRLAQVIHKRPP